MLHYLTITEPGGANYVYALGNWANDGTDDAEITARVDAAKTGRSVPSDWAAAGWDVCLSFGTLGAPIHLVSIGRVLSAAPPPGYDT